MRVIGGSIVDHYSRSLLAAQRPEATYQVEAALARIQSHGKALPHAGQFDVYAFFTESPPYFSVQISIGKHIAGARFKPFRSRRVAAGLYPAALCCINPLQGTVQYSLGPLAEPRQHLSWSGREGQDV